MCQEVVRSVHNEQFVDESDESAGLIVVLQIEHGYVREHKGVEVVTESFVVGSTNVGATQLIETPHANTTHG